MWKYWLKQQRRLALAHIDRMLGAPKLRRRFRRCHGYPLNLKNPQAFAEKIQWRKLYDKNPIFPILSNKYLVRDYITERLGHERAKELMVPLLQYANDPDAIDFATLPAQFVLKASHGSGMNLIVEDGSGLDQMSTRKLMRKWLLRHYKVQNHEWVYTRTPKGILAEALIAGTGQLSDLKFFCFDGKVRGFHINDDHGDRMMRTHFDAHARYLDVRKCGIPNNPDIMPPAWLDEMTALAEILSQGLDFVRVDFMYTPDRFYLGELSLLPGGGYNVFEPSHYDQELGRFWIKDMT